MGGYGSQGYGLIGLVVVVAIILLRNNRPRRLRIERLWIRPLLYVVLLATTLAAAPPPATPGAVGPIVLALLVGATLGWQRGRLMRIDADPQTHELSVRTSPVGMILILGLVILRLGLRSLAANASLAGLSAALAADALLVMAVAMMIAQSGEMWLRARRLLARAKAAKPAAGAH
ncbi:MAG: DUF1453 domain-containing protein [Caulobacteraceae bacterium]